MVGGSAVVNVDSVKRQASQHLSSRACEDQMHGYSPVPNPKLLVETVHLPGAQVTMKVGTMQYLTDSESI